MKIYSIFNSIDGEVNRYGQGIFSTFIRFSGCNLGCLYCDTLFAHGLDDGTDMSIKEILTKVKDIGCKKITITGGEPLVQYDDCYNLVSELIANKFVVTIETNGAFPIMQWEKREYYGWVMDYKLDQEDKMIKTNFKYLTYYDNLKFVISSRCDYLRMKDVIKNNEIKARISISPVHTKIQPMHTKIQPMHTKIQPIDTKIQPIDIISWVQSDKLFRCDLNIQIHKYLNLP